MPTTSATVAIAWESGSADFGVASGSGVAAKSAEVPYIVQGAASEYEAAEATMEAAPAEFHGLRKATVSVRERLGGDSWKTAVAYEPKKDGDQSMKPGTSGTEPQKCQFSTGGGTLHIETPLASIRRVGPNGSEPAHPGVIEPDDDGNPRGVDVPVPLLRMTEFYTMPDSSMGHAAKIRLAGYVGTINLLSYHGFKPGELRFDGAEFSDRTGDDGKTVWDVSLNFSFQPTQYNIDCGGGIVVPAKAGWDYIWKMTEPVTVDGRVRRRVVAAFVDRLYRVADFAGILP